VRALAVDGAAVFALCDKGLLQFNADGSVETLAAPEAVAGAQSLAVTPQAIWLGGKEGVSRWDRASGVRTPWRPAIPVTSYDRVLFDGAGGIYVYESDSAQFSAFDTDGKLRWRAHRIYDLPDTLAVPEAVARKKSGEVYVADAENNRILRFAPDGQFLGRIPDNFCRPHGLAALPDDRLMVLTDYTERLDAPLLTLLDPRDNPVADWVSNARVVSVARPVFFSYILGYWQKMGDHPARPAESFSPLSCCAVEAGRLLVGQAMTGSVKALDLTALGSQAHYPARLRHLHAQAITASQTSYTLHVDGTLDWTNTTRSGTHSGYTKTPLFMVDDAFTLTNDGPVPVVNPHFSVNGKGDLFDEPHILSPK
jgi:hypothetical protein